MALMPNFLTILCPVQVAELVLVLLAPKVRQVEQEQEGRGQPGPGEPMEVVVLPALDLGSECSLVS